MVTKKQVALFEGFDIETQAFRRCFFTYIDSDDQAWAGEVRDKRKHALTDEDIARCLTRQPDCAVFPPTFETVTVLPADADMSNLYIKRPQIHHLLDDGIKPLVPRMLAEEVQTLERLSQHPHPNIVTYHGCIVKRDRITGIALTRYNRVLEQRFKGNFSAFDVDNFETKCRSAIHHIHALDLAHNDINPSNIALDDKDEPVLIDWGSCKEHGQQLLSAGTPGWIDDDFYISDKHHDLDALAKVVEWIKKSMAEVREKHAAQ